MVRTSRTGSAMRGLRWGLLAGLVVLAVWPMVDAAPTVQRTKQQPKTFGQGDAMDFLKKYGYLGKGGVNAKGVTGALLSEDTFSDAIKAYQAFSGLPVTGKLDAATVQLMRTPRCGVKDIDPVAPTKGRHKRYALEGSKWWKHALTYHVSQPLSSAPTASSGGGGLGSWLGSWLGLGGGGGGKKTVSGGGGGGKRLDAAAAEAAVERALGVWAERSGLTFTRAAPQSSKGGAAADLDVRFERGAHGHCDDFDGRGGTLAHAYYPRFGGDAHFDADEHWTLAEYRGTNFFQVAVHEFGHSVGLRHSDHPDAVMAPVYRGYDPYFELHQDDIDAIQDLYGSPTHSSIQMAQQQEDDEEQENDPGRSGEDDEGNKGQEDKDEDDSEGKDGDGRGERKDGSQEKSEESEEEEEEEEDDEAAATPKNELCDDPSVDAMFDTPGGDIYVLKGAWYYRLGAGGGVLAGYPRPLAERWPGLPPNVDAAFASAAGSVYFFKGALYWRYDAADAADAPRLADGFPRRVAHGLPGAPDAPDAALLRPADGRLYLFKGAQFWRYERSGVGGSYTPRPLRQWQGVPAGLDAAFFHGGYTYFFKDGLYYRFDDVAFKVDEGSPPFPRSSAAWWFGCRPKALTQELTDK